MTHRPQCVSCGDRYGTRRVTAETVRWPKGEPIPAYKGNGRVVNTSQPYMLNARGGASDVPTFTTTRWIWDGESYGSQHQPFCSLQCALKYARKAYNATQEARP
jgi:hypothetical protein